MPKAMGNVEFDRIPLADFLRQAFENADLLDGVARVRNDHQ